MRTKIVMNMKTRMVLVVLMVAAGWAAQAQTNKLFWVVETNKQQQATVIRFYDDKNNLVKEEVVTKELNIARKRDMKFIEQKLHEAEKQQVIAFGKRDER
jgi:hypothetical protein